MRGFRVLKLGKVHLLSVGDVLIIYKDKEPYQKWKFRTILKDLNGNYYSFDTIEVKDLELRIFNLNEYNYDKNLFELTIYNKNYITNFKFEVVKKKSKTYIKPLKEV
jgi:hypothetical protein